MKDDNEWKTFDVAAGQEIVGLYCHARTLQVIPCLGFLLRPKQGARATAIEAEEAKAAKEKEKARLALSEDEEIMMMLAEYE